MLRILSRSPVISPSTPDSDLVRSAQRGEGDAFRALFERHVVSVRRFLRDLIRGSDLADDATQETFARAHAQLFKLAERDRFKPWLFGIARNVALESLRLKRHEVLEEDDDIPTAVIPSPDPERVLLDAELHGHFTQALGLLSKDRRAALLMRVDHGLPYEDIAAVLGWSIPTVKNEIHRARLKLRAHLLPHLTGDHL